MRTSTSGRYYLPLSFVVFAIAILTSPNTYSQLNGVKYIPGDYATVTAAVAAVNASGVGAGGVTFNVAANYTETVGATISLTATGTAANPIVFQKDAATSGANPLITAYTGGTATPQSAVQDGIWRLVGADYVTIKKIDLRDNPSNTTNPSTMEYGFALYKASSSNGCQFDKIEGCTVTLSNVNNASATNPMTEGSAGIIVMNATALNANVVISAIAGGSNSNNKFYGNTIQNCNIGISMIGYTAASPFTLADTNNDIGGNSSSTGNTVINYGGAAGATNSAAGIRTLAQYGLNISYNTVNNNNGSGSNHPATIRGIYINSAASASTAITNNTITINGGGTTQNILAIDNAAGSTAAGNTINISRNNIINGTYSTATTANFYGIYNAATPEILTINNNTVAGNSFSSSGVYYAIENVGSVKTAINIDSNNIGNSTLGAFTFNGANASSQAFIYNQSGSATAALSMSNNNFQGINYAVQGTGNCSFITNSAATLSQSINNNTFTGLNINTTGNVTFLSNSVILAATGTQNINNNSIVSSFTKSGAGGSVTLFTSTATSAAGGVSNNKNNNFSNITISGTTTMAGWVNTDAGAATKYIQNNTFSNWTVGAGAVNAMNINLTGANNAVSGNTIGAISGGASVTGITTAAGNDKIYSNTISSLSTTGGSTVSGILVTAGTTKNVYGNKIYDLVLNNAGGTVTGISVTGSTIKTVNIYNNLIGNLTAPIANTTSDVIRGISVTATAVNSNVNAYYNTIYLNATSSGANFSSTGIYHTVNATSTTVALNLRNNIISNTSTPKGTGITVAYRRSGTALGNYANTSNNNLLYGGNPGSNRLIFYDGTNSVQTIIAYKTLVSAMDALSVTEDLITGSKFISTTGSSAYFLHLDSTKANLAESGAINIANYTSDFDFKTRQGNAGYAGSSSAPDIGAAETNGTRSSALSGMYSVGTGQTYTSLTNAGGFFAAINSLGLSGNVAVNITSDLAEDGSNSLYQWAEQGGANYILTIQPDASASRLISGDVLNGLIRFNGAKRVVINGSNGTSNNYLTFRNTNAAGTTGTAFTFVNGASNNSISYSNIEAFTNATTGAILFGTSTESGGNSNNTISNCSINATVSGNTGTLCIYSTGTATAGYANSNNTISNNNVYNYRDRAIDVTSTGTTSWTISGNNFYNGSISGSIDYAANYILHTIRILGGAGYTIANNYIGGSASLALGSAAVYSSSTGLVTYQGILLTTTGASPASNIKGNKIANISMSAIPTSVSGVGTNVFFGIETNGSGINIGGSLAGEGNVIGSNTANSSIAVTTTTQTTNRSNIRGINCNSTGGVIVGNQVASVDIKNIGSNPGPSTFTGIYINNAVPPAQVAGNIIGSTGPGAAANSIRVLASSTCTTTAVTGIFLNTSVTSAMQVTGNTIQNLSNAVSTATSAIIGISNTAALNAFVTINNNTITGISTNASTGGIYNIYNNSAASSITISSNTISGNASTSGTSGYLYGIYTTGASAAITINNNVFSGNSTASLSSSGFSGIYNAASPTSLTITGNTFYGNTAGTATASFYAIFNAGAVTGTVNINSNNIGTISSNAITYSVANTAGQILINNTGGTATTFLSVSNNTFQGISFPAGGSGAFTFISNNVATLSQALNGNTFTNLNLNSSGNVTFISDNVVVPASGTQGVNNNSISGTFTKSAGGTVTLFTSSASSPSGSVINNSNNNFSNITVSGGTVIAGWVNTDAGASKKMIQNNIFSNWTGGTSSITGMTVNLAGTNNAVSGNQIYNLTGASSVTGISTSTGNNNIYSNIIYSLTTTGAFAANGINITGGTTANIYKNKIYDLVASTNATGTVNGIAVQGGTTVNVFNNLIGNLRTPAGSASDPVRGISVTSTAASSTINVYYNTIYLNASSTGTNFGTTGIYHTTSGTATTSSLNLRNNSVTNISSANGTGYTVAYRLSSTALTNYASTSNNNLFYSGTPGAKKLIFWDGTNADQTLASYKGRVATRDAASVTEDLTAKFLSTTGSSSVFLHMDTTIASAVNSGGANITGFTDDFDGQTRYGNAGYSGTSTAPSIGADEIFGIESIPPAITYTPLGNTTLLSNRVLAGVVITDASGINTSAGYKPRIYFKRSSDANTLLDNSSTTNGWKYTEATNSASPFSFTIDYSLLYGGSSVTAGVIQYFIVAQDLATTANVAVNSATFSSSPSSVEVSFAAFPATGAINSYNIAFSGTYNVGSTEVFTSLTKSDGLFASINSSGLMGNTIVSITSDLAEDGANALNQWTESAGSNYTLTIQSDAATLRTISGNVASGLIRFNGADRVTIDGSNSGSGNYLTFRNNNTSGSTGTSFTFINGASNNTIKYSNVEASANATNGVVLFSTSTVAGGNSNNLIDNCAVNATVGSNTGIAAIYSGGTAGNENASNTVSNNTIYGYKDRGIDITSSGSTGWTISGNSIYNGNVTGAINYPASSALQGVRVLGGSGYSIVNNAIGGSAAFASGSNAVYSSNLGSISYQGISLTTASASPSSSIKGNIVTGINITSVPTSAASTLFTGIETNGFGITIGGSTAGDGNQVGISGSNGAIIITSSTTSAANTSVIKGINCSSTGGSINGNQVAGIDINNIGTVPASSSFTGLYINSSTPPAQVINNIIGSRETTNSLRVPSTSGATATSLAGITIGSLVTSNMLISGNLIQNISHQSPISSGSFTGISNGASSGIFTITYDTIQNITGAANAYLASTTYTGISSGAASSLNFNVISNITLLSTGVNAQVVGISVAGAVAHTITGNFISNLSAASSAETASVETASPVASAVAGILNAATASGQVISANTLYNFKATRSTALNTLVTGIGITSSSAGNIFGNRISSFTNQATGSGPGLIGVSGTNGSYNLYNNSIRMDNLPYVNGVKIYGIVHASNSNWNFFHNTVSIAGSATGTALRSAAYVRSQSGSLLSNNNIFANTRTGTGKNYAVSNIASSPSAGWPSSASDYNAVYSSNTNTLAEWGTGSDKTFAQWKIVSGGGANSVSQAVSFISSTYDLEVDSTNCALNGSGVPITSPIAVNTDIKNVLRSSVSPDMGAYEFDYIPYTVYATNNSPVCAAGSLSLFGDPGTAVSATYSWKNPNDSVVSTAQNPFVTPIAGIYTVTVTDINGCVSKDTTLVALTPAPTAALAGPSFVCSGGTATLSLTLTGTGTFSGTLNSGDNFNSSTSPITIDVSPSATTSYYITSLSDDNCTSLASDHPDTARINVLQTGDWTGVVSTDWNDAGNWSCGGIPAAGTNVTIPAPAAFYPVITGSVSVNNITIASGASITVAGTFSIAGAISNHGTFNADSATIIMNGTSDQTVPEGMFSGNSVRNLIISNNVTLAGAVYVSGAVSFGNVNNKTLTSAGFLTIRSSSLGTARVADITNGGTNSGNTISGSVTLEKYIPAKRAYRFLTSPANTTAALRANWMENTNNTNTSVNNNPVPGYGTHITGALGNTNGFDATQTNNGSMFGFDNQTQAWTPVPNTAGLLKAGTAYRILVRGSRSTDLNLAAPTSSPTILRSTGTLVNGTVVMAKPAGGGTANMPELSSSLNGFSFIGNPYASPVNWLTIEKTDIGSTMYIFDPTISGSNGRGGYVSYNATYSSNNNASSLIDNNIQSWQSFFVYTTGANPSLTFKEIHKTSQNRAVFRTAGTLPRLTVQLLLPQQLLTGGSADGFAAYFSDNFSALLGDEDSYKFSNQDENVGIFRDGKVLSIEGRHTIVDNDTLPVKMWQLSQPAYTFKIGSYDFDASINCYLEDAYLQTSTFIKPDSDTLISFSINSDPASSATDRFRFVFKTGSLLPVQLADVKAFERNKGADIEWTVSSQNDMKYYEVERSGNATQFRAIGQVDVIIDPDQPHTYLLHDAAPLSGDNFYRIKLVSKSGKIRYSKVVKLDFSGSKASIVVFPNPVDGNVLHLQLLNLAKGVYTLQLLDASGQQVYADKISYTGGTTERSVKINTLIAKGIYDLRLSSGSTQYTTRVVVR